ncbi:MAG: TonB-dependent receptor [Pseudomonadota bacterium]
MYWKVVGTVCALASIWGQGVALATEAEVPVDRLSEIVVTGTRTPHTLKDAPVETVLITRVEIERSNAQTVTDILKNVPGLNASGVDDVFGSTSARVRLQGLSFNDGYGLVLIDGQRLHGSAQSGSHGEYAVGLNQIPVAMIERIEVVKGPGSVLYGSDAMAGVINIITRKTPKETVAGASASYGWYNVKEQVASGVTTKPTDDGHHRNLSEYSMYFGDSPHEKIGYLFTYAYEGTENIGKDSIPTDRHSVMAKTDIKLTDDLGVWLKGEASVFDREGVVLSPATEDSYRIAAGGSWQPSDKHEVQLKGYHYLDDFTAASTTSDRNGTIGYDQAEAQYTLKLDKTQAITLGTEFQRQGIDYKMHNKSSNLSTTTTVNEDVDTWSLFAQDELTFFNDLVLVPGVRYDDHSTYGDSFNPKLGMMYHLFQSTTIRGSVGKAFKSPTIRQLYYDVPFYHSPFWVESNPDLKPEKSIGYTLGIEQWLLNDRIVLNLGCFRNDIEDMVITQTSGRTFNGQELRVYSNVDEAMTQGFDVGAKIHFNKDLTLTASYTYTDTEDKENDLELTYSPNHQVRLTPAYEYAPLGLGFSSVLSYNSRQYSDDANLYEVDDYVAVDANIYKRLGKKGKLTFQADNIFDSDKGDERSFREGRTFIVKMDINF